MRRQHVASTYFFGGLERCYTVRLGEIRPFPLSHFAGYAPPVTDEPSPHNEAWSHSPKFFDLGDTLAYFLAKPIASAIGGVAFEERLAEKTRSLAQSKFFVKGNYAFFERKTYPHKRYVRLGIRDYHPNAFGVFFETTFSPSTKDGLVRDHSDRSLILDSFPIRESGLNCFVGLSAIKHADVHGR